MRKLLLTLFFALSLSQIHAQTATTTLITAPCTANGVFKVNVTGLTPPLVYTYYFGMSGYIPPITHPSSLTVDTLSGWMGGTVFIYVRDTFYNTASTYFSSGPLTMSFTSTSATCPALGSITASVSGGTSPYTYHWYNSSSVTAGTTNPLNATPGYYYLIATDAGGCYLDSRYTMDSSTYLMNLPAFSFSPTSTDASCTNGTASVGTISGGTSPFTYLWSNGATSSTITGLTKGTFTVNVTDALGCSVDSVFVYVSQSPVITVHTTATPATCLNNDGAIIAFGSGGVSPYSYVWSNGATTQSQTGIAAGYYMVTATDANGCTGDGYDYISVSSPITVTYATTPSSCTAPTGTATLTVGGGTAPYTIVWYTSPGQTGTHATGLPSGYYSFHITDAVGCVQSGAVYIPPINVVMATVSTTSATCISATGAASVTPYGGVAPYTYSWSSGGGTASHISGVVAGSYNVLITDHNGCTLNQCVNIYVTSPVSIGFSSTQASCLFTSDGSITAAATGGTSPYTYSWSNGGTTPTISGLPTHLYWVSVHDAAGCTAWDTLTLGYNAAADFCYCTIAGYVYYDANGNCTQNTGEPGINHIQLHCSGIGYTYTDTTGYYSFKVPTGSYTVSQNILGYYPLSTCQSNNITAAVTAASGCVHPINFADTLNPIHDMHICTWDYNHAIPGNTYTQTTIISNRGSVTEPAILAGYKADGQLYSPAITPSGVFTSGGSYYYGTAGTFPTLNAGFSQQFLMDYSVPTNIPLGTNVIFKDTVSYASPMSNWLTDYSPWNNTRYFTTTVVSSYDPNFKEVSPKGYGSNGTITYKDSVLDYMVHFQNTGTWFAQNIVVIDTLDADLDWTTLSPVFESHNCQVSISETGVAKFTFTNINLPAQMYDDLRSNGMFSYTIKTKRGLAIGTQFKNRAAIFFDYNPPIFTNQTVNTLGWPQSLPSVPGPENNSSFTLYPNPANSSFSAIINSDIEASYSLRVMDITGKTMINKTLALHTGAQTINVDAALLSPGVYFVNLSGENKTETQKLVIIK